MRKIAFLITSIVILSAASSWYVYAWQHGMAISLEHKNASLARQVNDVQKRYDVAVSAATVNTSSWKKYCDPLAPFCFSYPAQWALDGGGAGEFGYVRASVTNPEKTVQIDYASPLVKDGGPSSAHIVKIVDFTVASQKLTILGSYPVSSGTYGPGYSIRAWAQPASTLGKVALIGEPAIFDVGKYHAIRLAGYPTKKLTSRAQAEAWFDSIDGKTVEKVLESFSEK